VRPCEHSAHLRCRVPWTSRQSLPFVIVVRALSAESELFHSDRGAVRCCLVPCRCSSTPQCYGDRGGHFIPGESKQPGRELPAASAEALEPWSMSVSIGGPRSTGRTARTIRAAHSPAPRRPAWRSFRRSLSWYSASASPRRPSPTRWTAATTSPAPDLHNRRTARQRRSRAAGRVRRRAGRRAFTASSSPA
jgi:hypothetical protein